MPGVLLVYDTSCTSTSGVCCGWTVPAGTYQVTFEAWGGGGGGGTTGTNCDCCSRGGPGAGGAYSKVTVSTSPGTVYTVCAGPGGVSSGGWGAYCGICCQGCPGGTSWVSGSGLSNFCATGGAGGYSDFNNNCYSHCGCNQFSQGFSQGYGGDTRSHGTWGTWIHYAYNSNPLYIANHAGSAGGTQGGTGGRNLHYCNSGYGCAFNGESMLHGKIPGGGGAGSGFWQCCACTPWASGRGGPGMVKITY